MDRNIRRTILVAVALVAAPSSARAVAAAERVEAAAETISVFPAQLDFGPQLIGSTATSKTLILTAGRAAASVVVASQGAFYEATPKGCELAKGASCAVDVAFSPKRTGDYTGVLSVKAASGRASETKVVLLSGRGTTECDACPRPSDVASAFRAALPVCGGVVLFMTMIVLVRWNMIVTPTRNLLRRDIADLKNRVKTLRARNQAAGKPAFELDQADALDDLAAAAVAEEWSWSWAFDVFFWTRGQEMQGWKYLHSAEIQMIPCLDDDEVGALLENLSRVLRLREGDVAATQLADGIHDELTARPVSRSRRNAVLAVALEVFYDGADHAFGVLNSWHNKTTWLIGCGLLLIVCLAAALQHEVFFLLGAVGGLLSRISRALKNQNVPTDYGASWTSLFMSPVAGALAGWAGVLLVNVAVGLGVLGAAFKIDWCAPYCPMALGLALVMGVSERFFDTIVDKINGKADPGSDPKPKPKPGSGSVDITTPADLRGGKAGAPYDVSLAATGGTGALTWRLSDGELPKGLSLDPAGKITGTPQSAGKAKFELKVVDSAFRTCARIFTINID